MLRLDRLQLSGFKSFVDQVGLDFAGGMTAIVGPNGCGKSNVADAVMWVLGERSARTLRGQTMEDVIFSGSASRKPLGMAEVSLTLHSDPGTAASEDGRLVLGRRLFRDGESQYLINGKKVRLKEIRDLLMDTGLGIRAYSVIEQGKIGMILSGKPQERRRLLEEAAGITRYKERRRIAELKLEEARANLARLEDILSEVERTVRSLKRQAGAARRYRDRQRDLQELLRRFLAGRWGGIGARLAEVESRIAVQVERDAELTASLHREEAALAAGREELEGLGRDLAERHQRDTELAARIEGKQEFLKGSRHRLQEIAERIGAGRELARSREEAVARLRERLGELEGKLEAVLGERDRAASEVSEDEQRIGQVERLVSDAEGRLESLRGRLLSSISDLTGLRNRLHREELEREKGQLRLRHLHDELAARKSELAEAEKEARAGAARLEELKGQVAEREEELGSSRRRLEQLEARDAELDSAERQTEARLTRLEQRRELLTELAQAQEERRQRIRRALERAGVERPTFLFERMRVPEGWERSLDLYLGELADGVLVGPESDRLALARTLAEGPGTVRLIAAEGWEPAAPAIQDPAVRSSLGEALGLAPAIAAALPPAYLVDSPTDAERLARLHPGAAFLCRDRIWVQAGVLHVQGQEAQPGLLAREHDLARLSRELPPLEEHLGAVRGEREELGAEAERLRETRAGLDAELAELRREVAVAAARSDDLEARRRRLSVERETVETEAGEIERELAGLARQTALLEQELRRSETLHGEMETAFDTAQREVDSSRQERESSRTSGASRRGRLELLQERLDSHRQEIARIEEEIEEGGRQVKLWREEADALRKREAEIGEAMRAAEGELQEALELRDASRSEIAGAQESLDARRAELKRLEETIEGLRSERDETRAALAELRVEEATERQEAEHIREEFRQHFGEEPPAEPGEPEGDMAEIESDLERCRGILQRLGPVNLLAADEYEEQKERAEFLSTQRDDVAASVDSLRRTIREINQTSSSRFLAAFEAVNEHFRATFTELFRGGKAEMRLMDEEDVLECGIEIVARPPGKRLQNMMLLSGGEKALTAIALLFALFKTKPSPFCILDEVDAPLDDLNTLRFVEMLKRRSRETQFVIITHNKLTMEAASVLYGVTMQERGVSDLVSVELDDVQPAESAAVATASA